MQEVEQRMEQLPTTAWMQEVEQRMEQLPRVAVGLKAGKDEIQAPADEPFSGSGGLHPA